MIFLSGEARFVSVTYRLFKLPPGAKTEPLQVMYNGEITGYEKEFKFDHQHVFKVGFYNYLIKHLLTSTVRVTKLQNIVIQFIY